MNIVELAMKVQHGQSLRFDCPECGGNNTLSITNSMGELVWQCFKASCNIAGRKSLKKTPEQMMDYINVELRDTFVKSFTLPDHITSVQSSSEAGVYLRDMNCWAAYMSGLADIRYDPRQRRVVFCVYDPNTGKLVDAIGRALDAKHQGQPRWWRYGRSGIPFIAGTDKMGVIVEDAASACAVAPHATGIAIMGTSLHDTAISCFKPYREIVIALDYDATTKALEMERYLSYFLDKVRVLPLLEDLKYEPPEKIRALLGLKLWQANT